MRGVRERVCERKREKTKEAEGEERGTGERDRRERMKMMGEIMGEEIHILSPSSEIPPP